MKPGGSRPLSEHRPGSSFCYMGSPNGTRPRATAARANRMTLPGNGSLDSGVTSGLAAKLGSSRADLSQTFDSLHYADFDPHSIYEGYRFHASHVKPSSLQSIPTSGGQSPHDTHTFTRTAHLTPHFRSEVKLEHEIKRLYHTLRNKNAEISRQDILISQLQSALLDRENKLSECTALLSMREFAQYPSMAQHIPEHERKLNAYLAGKPHRRPPSKRTKRNAISGETSQYLMQGDRKGLKVQSFEKADYVKEQIRRAILENDFMKHLDAQQIAEIIDSMILVRFQKDSWIIQEGEVGSVVYVIGEGFVQVSKKGDQLRTLGMGKVFGELAILYNCTRTASVRAIADCSLWAIDRQCFQTIMMRTGLRRQEEYLNFLKSVPTFNSLANEVLMKVADKLSEVHYDAGEYIIREGARGDTFYIIAKGKVKVTKNVKEKQEEKFIRFMNPGDWFGEKALMNEDVRTANILATEQGVDCLVLDRESYNLLIRDWVALERKYSDEPSQSAVRKCLFLDTNVTDLLKLVTIGVGGFGRVELVHFRTDEKHTFALKKLKRNAILQTRQQEHVMNERNILLEANHDFIIKLYRTYKDRHYVYFLLEACLGGELWTILRTQNKFNDSTTRFYTACVVEALCYLHRKGIIYRDLKPENLLLDREGYCKLTDFGFAKKIGFCCKTWTFCGTPEYVAPEIILNKGHDFSVDIWSLGILMFELLMGTPPFSSTDPMHTYNIILKGINAIEFPNSITRNAQALIKRLCRENPTERLGSGKCVGEVKKHVWFEGFNWTGLTNRALQPPIKPNIKSAHDVSNFDAYDSDDDVPPEDSTNWAVDF